MFGYCNWSVSPVKLCEKYVTFGYSFLFFGVSGVLRVPICPSGRVCGWFFVGRGLVVLSSFREVFSGIEWTRSWVPEVWSSSWFPGWSRSVSAGLYGRSM